MMSLPEKLLSTFLSYDQEIIVDFSQVLKKSIIVKNPYIIVCVCVCVCTPYVGQSSSA